MRSKRPSHGRGLLPWLAGSHERLGLKDVNEQNCQITEAPLLAGSVHLRDTPHLHHLKLDVLSLTACSLTSSCEVLLRPVPVRVEPLMSLSGYLHNDDLQYTYGVSLKDKPSVHLEEEGVSLHESATIRLETRIGLDERRSGR